MKLYHLSAPNDAAGEQTLHTVEGRVTEAGGYVHLSRGFGAAEAVLVIVLPDAVNPAEIGLEGAEWRVDLPNAEPTTGTAS